MEEKPRDYGFIKNLLNNNALLRWVKKFSADGLQEEPQGKNFDVETDEESLAISDVASIKMFFSSSRFAGKTYASFDIKQIKEVLSLLEGEGRLIINEHDNKRFCYIQSQENVIVIAPVNEAEESKKKKKSDKVEETSKE